MKSKIGRPAARNWPAAAPGGPCRIDRDHALVDDPLVHEGDRAFGTLRNVVKHLAAEGGDRGGRSHYDQHLVLARADGNLLERAGGQDVALLELLAGASRPAQRLPARSRRPRACRASARPKRRGEPTGKRFLSLVSVIPELVPSPCVERGVDVPGSTLDCNRHGPRGGVHLRNPQCFGRSIMSTPAFMRHAQKANFWHYLDNLRDLRPPRLAHLSREVS